MMILKSESVSCSVMSDFLQLHELCSLPGSSVHGILQARILDWVPFPSLRDLPHPGMEPGSPALQADSLPSEPQGKLFHKHMSHPCPGVMLVFSVSFQF